MRRLCALLSLVCLIGTVGCDKHVCGVCDCSIPGHQCASCCAWHHFAPGVQMEAIRREAGKAVEPIKEMPKVEKKGGEKGKEE